MSEPEAKFSTFEKFVMVFAILLLLLDVFWHLTGAMPVDCEVPPPCLCDNDRSQAEDVR